MIYAYFKFYGKIALHPKLGHGAHFRFNWNVFVTGADVADGHSVWADIWQADSS